VRDKRRRTHRRVRVARQEGQRKEMNTRERWQLERQHVIITLRCIVDFKLWPHLT
jgi:hypothetical protein